MSRYEQRKRELLKHPEIAAGYWEMDAELRLVAALNAVRAQMHLTTEELARRMGRQREAVSRLLNAEHPNPTLDTLTDLLTALGLTAEIHLRRAQGDEPPIRVDSTDVA
ncbi:MAG: XRE family transcriptional regulator [Ktedonobacterales bacterium]